MKTVKTLDRLGTISLHTSEDEPCAIDSRLHYLLGTAEQLIILYLGKCLLAFLFSYLIYLSISQSAFLGLTPCSSGTGISKNAKSSRE